MQATRVKIGQLVRYTKDHDSVHDAMVVDVPDSDGTVRILYQVRPGSTTNRYANVRPETLSIPR